MSDLHLITIKPDPDLAQAQVFLDGEDASGWIEHVFLDWDSDGLHTDAVIVHVMRGEDEGSGRTTMHVLMIQQISQADRQWAVLCLGHLPDMPEKGRDLA